MEAAARRMGPRVTPSQFGSRKPRKTPALRPALVPTRLARGCRRPGDGSGVSGTIAPNRARTVSTHNLEGRLAAMEHDRPGLVSG